MAVTILPLLQYSYTIGLGPVFYMHGISFAVLLWLQNLFRT